MSGHTGDGVTPAWRRAFRGGPDPTFRWLGHPHREALEALCSAVARGEPLLLLTGEAGAGKTTLADAVAARLGGDGVVVGRLAYPPRDRPDFWSAVAGALLPGTSGAPEVVVPCFARHVEQAARTSTRLLLILDEAQALASEVLTEVLHAVDVAHDAAAEHVLSILLVGEDELDVTLAAPKHAGLARRITARRRLPALQADAAAEYIRHRLRCAGAPPDVFSPEALAAIAELSRGLPRLIDTVCERTAAGGGAVDASVVQRCGRELAWLCNDPAGSPPPGDASLPSVLHGRQWRARGVGVAALAAIGVLAVTALVIGHRPAVSRQPDAGPSASGAMAGAGPARSTPLSERLRREPDAGEAGVPDPQPNSRARSSDHEPEPPDPRAVIDWLLEQRAAARR